MKKIKVAITGGIGSGKSSVSDYLEKKGHSVLRADLIAKELMAQDAQIKKKLIEEFGEESYSNDKLNTKYLAANAFSNEENVQKINSIVHPPVMEKIDQLAKEIFKNQDIVFIETALVYEANLEDFFDYVLLVLADEKTRIERIINRETVTEEQVRARMQYQIPDEEKKDDADFVLDNNTTLQELENRVEFLLILIRQLTA
ncbi:MAG: dephospho-CoA kinase [Stygiobacter sp. RIFOXYC12_FULL_38_8]|nr:MAG: dephospho-CoA kinase [Stygiobacter sp. GWC2_38_9]OGV06114.1 MAG: dephospho-CoA kinase [Stygiobacter sp. RIFOXYB2_FULL_37_11]OGV16821.1 MAG: dephospho-CoA kinase [Stygiobacter sp. RIFOXYC2_FULL_38_25]OGV17347.1 MAG: dephospho-CoA kinase [Stygiobacter sp. RIFOXYA2_FULL_38_8]OGV23466.1 MAG: dephospho-CoA kinase [Stygiobacter sp. RIFOXYC12_FULL_38_8]OGV82828.1 MAG: dephospho-CoA kinase [Stygiobacter sp. GWF2_38_21]OGV98247.1 MAG: dephospho-CoA kinase [Melioribacter sp. RIFOXYB12_FULL_38_5